MVYPNGISQWESQSYPPISRDISALAAWLRLLFPARWQRMRSVRSVGHLTNWLTAKLKQQKHQEVQGEIHSGLIVIIHQSEVVIIYPEQSSPKLGINCWKHVAHSTHESHVCVTCGSVTYSPESSRIPNTARKNNLQCGAAPNIGKLVYTYND